jgi:hypothetical protein
MRIGDSGTLRAQFDNGEGVKFCEECGAKFELECPACKAYVPLGRKSCGECGHNFESPKDLSTVPSEAETLAFHSATEQSSGDATPIAGKRKHVTVLFALDHLLRARFEYSSPP